MFNKKPLKTEANKKTIDNNLVNQVSEESKNKSNCVGGGLNYLFYMIKEIFIKEEKEKEIGLSHQTDVNNIKTIKEKPEDVPLNTKVSIEESKDFIDESGVRITSNNQKEREKKLKSKDLNELSIQVIEEAENEIPDEDKKTKEDKSFMEPNINTININDFSSKNCKNINQSNYIKKHSYINTDNKISRTHFNEEKSEKTNVSESNFQSKINEKRRLGKRRLDYSVTSSTITELSVIENQASIKVGKNDAVNVLQRKDFPSAICDYTNLNIDLEDPIPMIQKYGINETIQYSIAIDEQANCIYECEFIKEGDYILQILLLLTNKNIFILNIISETSVSINTIISSRDIISIFYKYNDIYLIINNFNNYFKLHFKVQNQGNPNAIDNYSETTYYLIIMIWRIVFLNNNVFLKVIELPDTELIDKLKLNSKYLENFFLSIFRKNIELLKLLLSQKEENNEKERSSNKENQENEESKINQIKTIKLNKNTPISVCYCSFRFSQKSYIFMNKDIGYFRVIVFFLNDILVIYEIVKQRVCYIKLHDIISIHLNESRLILIIIISNETIEEKIVLFNEEIGTDEYKMFSRIFGNLMEYSKMSKYRYSVHFGSFNEIVENYFYGYYEFFNFDERNLNISSEKKDEKKKKVISKKELLMFQTNKSKTCCNCFKNSSTGNGLSNPGCIIV